MAKTQKMTKALFNSNKNKNGERKKRIQNIAKN